MRTLSFILLLTPLAFGACKKDDSDATDTDATDTDATDTDVETEECTSVTLDEGNTGTYTVDSSIDDHEKKHWTMPSGIDHLVVVGTWTEAEWNMKLDVGEGWCPHSGTSYADDYSTGGELTVEVFAADLPDAPEYFEEGSSWFAHFGLFGVNQPDDGSTSDYALDVKTCTALGR